MTETLTRVLDVGDRVWLRMSYSEVCMHMGVAGHRLEVEVREGGAQLHKDGSPFSFPITYGEAGIYRDAQGRPYVHDRKLTGDEIFELQNSCDGLALLVDEAAHQDDYPLLSHIQTHVRECEFCTEVNADVLEWVA